MIRIHGFMLSLVFFPCWAIGTASMVVASAIPSSAQIFTTLVSFEEPDAAFPYAPLLQGTDGNLYGTTQRGEVNGRGFGTVFNITPAGVLTKLYTFCAPDCQHGSEPISGLVQGSDLNFYGTTYLGGAHGTPLQGGNGLQNYAGWKLNHPIQFLCPT